MESIKALSRGTKLVLGAGPLLFLSLFFNWQMLEIDYGPAGIAKQPQDGWDAWGLVIALLVIATVTLVVLVQFTDVEMSEDVPWESVTLVLGFVTGAFAVLKNLTDANSTWTSYGFVVLAGAFAYGTYLIWAETHTTRNPLLGRRKLPGRRKRRRFSSAA
jgi:peptidoglycan/LPS O-acetylase OafA/YrhL